MVTSVSLEFEVGFIVFLLGLQGVLRANLVAVVLLSIIFIDAGGDSQHFFQSIELCNPVLTCFHPVSPSCT